MRWNRFFIDLNRSDASDSKRQNRKTQKKPEPAIFQLFFVMILFSGFGLTGTQWIRAEDAVASLQKSKPESHCVTFNQDIATLVHEKCAGCHRTGQSAPFPLLTYQDVAKRAETIEAVIDAGYMPPWKPVNHDVVFANSRELSRAEKDKLRQWIADGKPSGAGIAPTPPPFVDGWQLGKPDRVVKMQGRFEVPASGPDIYRSFVFPIQLPEDKWIKAIDYRPRAKESVHHALFFIDTDGAARRIDGSDGKSGIAGMRFLAGGTENAGGSKRDLPRLRSAISQLGRFQSGQTFPTLATALSKGLGGYAPGRTAAWLPGDLALRLPAGSDIVVQTHFHPSGKAEIEEGELGLYFADRAPSRKIVPIQIPAMFGAGVGLRVPAGERDYKIGESFRLPIDTELISVAAHAHYICRTAKLTARLPSGETLVLLQIDDWDLDWQDQYPFETPIPLPAGTVLTSELTYDNSADNPENPNSPPVAIRWGRESGDEMGSITVQAVARDAADEKTLESAVGQYFFASLTQGDVVDVLMQLDTNRDGGLQKIEAPPRLAQRFSVLDANDDQKLDRQELEFIRDILKRLKEAR